MARAYHSDLRKRAIALLESGVDKKTVSTTLQIVLGTLYRWWNAWKQEGRFEGLSGYQKGHSHKVTDLAEFESFMNANPGKNQQELGELWKEPCSDSTISRYISRIGYTYKKRASL